MLDVICERQVEKICFVTFKKSDTRTQDKQAGFSAVDFWSDQADQLLDAADAMSGLFRLMAFSAEKEIPSRLRDRTSRSLSFAVTNATLRPAPPATEKIVSPARIVRSSS